jgi:hypothetical protein
MASKIARSCWLFAAGQSSAAAAVRSGHGSAVMEGIVLFSAAKSTRRALSG